MKIGIVLSSTPTYSETFFNSKIKGLQGNGFEVCLFVQHRSEDFTLCKVVQSNKIVKNQFFQILAFIPVFIYLIPHIRSVLKFINLERKQNTPWFQIIKKVYLNAHLLTHKLDWLHFGFATQALGKELVAKSIGAKMAVSLRGFDINVYPLKHPNCYHLVWKEVDKVHSISNYLLEKAYKIGLNKEVPCQIITPAVDISKITEVKNFVSESKIRIMSIARIHWVKGLDKAIKVIALLKEKGYSVEFHIVGGGLQKDLERYQFEALELGVKENVIFHGKLSHHQTLELLKDIPFYIQTSLNEGFCNAVLEAQAYGKLCLAFNVGGLSENIENEVSGFIVEKCCPEKLANKLIDVINLKNKEKCKISMNAQKRVKEHFNIDKQQQEFINFYSS